MLVPTGIRFPATVRIRVGLLRPDAYNPRTITERQFEALKASIRRNGFVAPLVVQRSGHRIIGGHQRLLALQAISKEDGSRLAFVPCVLVDCSDREARLLNLALNRIIGDWDEEVLARVFAEEAARSPLTDEEVLASGFQRREVDSYVLEHTAEAPVLDPDPRDLAEFARSATLSIAFDSIAERDLVRASLQEMTQARGCRAGSIVRAALGLAQPADARASAGTTPASGAILQEDPHAPDDVHATS